MTKDRPKKIHLLNVINSDNALCGRRSTHKYSHVPDWDLQFAKSWNEVDCRDCMKTSDYQVFLKGKYREKPLCQHEGCSKPMVVFKGWGKVRYCQKHLDEKYGKQGEKE